MLECGRPREGDALVSLSGWVLTLGASSGFGEAASLALARAGLNIFGVHLDRKATLGNIERIVGEIKGLGREAVFFNVNAADPDKRVETAAHMQRVLEERGETGGLRVLLHSLAFGTLKPFVADPTKDAANAIRAGVTDTPALRKIPGHEAIVAAAKSRNPSGRMTTPEDVARALVVLSHPDTYWITGNVIGVDGGEDIVG